MMNRRGLAEVLALAACVAFGAGGLGPVHAADMLFPTHLPELQWVEFSAAGFTHPVAGVIYRTAQPTCCGVTLGGLGTGSLDIETAGVLGFCTFFLAPHREYSPWGTVPVDRNHQLFLPFLGLSVGSRTWVLTTQKFLDGGVIQGCTEPGNAVERKLKDDPEWRALWQAQVPRTEGVEPVKEIHYWGHFPVADLEYDTDSPVAVGLRAWSPFLPGDPAASNIPGIVFEVHLRNTTNAAQRGTLAFSFPGPPQRPPAHAEGGAPRASGALPRPLGPSTVARQRATSLPGCRFVRSEAGGDFHGTVVSSRDGEAGYALGVIGPERVRFGAGLSASPTSWSSIRYVLPAARPDDPSASAAVDFKLRPREAKVVRIVLAWYAPRWQGAWRGDAGTPPGPPRNYTAIYASRYRNALEVARHLAKEHESLLSRVLAWQQAIYAARDLPVWLRDCLINNLYFMADNSSWAQPDAALGDWSFPDGPFGLNESPRSCSIIGCIASNWYGDLPICYFFPQLERMILRNYAAYMRPDGAVPFLYGPGDWTYPSYEWQIGLNGPCFVDLVGRLWLRGVAPPASAALPRRFGEPSARGSAPLARRAAGTGDDEILREFYPAVKKSVTFTMTMKPAPEGVITVPHDGAGQEWWEHTPLYGMVTHFGGVRLCTLRIAERMAKRMGDQEFARQCREWFDGGSQALEEELWNERARSYVLYKDPKSGKQSDLIMSAQLDGDWAAVFHGLPGVFDQDRARTVLDTVRRTCVTDYGFVGFASPEEGAQLGAYGSFSAENYIVAMTYMYQGQRDFGLEMVRRFMENIVLKQRHTWDLPNMITCDTGERFFGTDYFQNMMLWAVPAGVRGEDLTGPCQPGGLVDRMLQAARAD